MSALRQYAYPAPSQAKYFIFLGGPSGVQDPAQLTDIRVQAVQFPPGGAPVDFVQNIYTDPSMGITNIYVLQNSLFKDLGRQFYVVDETGAKQLALFREAQLVSGLLTEGVSPTDVVNPSVIQGGYNTYWLKVWVSAPTNYPVSTATVSFVRVG
jgi:hypothetical protein